MKKLKEIAAIITAAALWISTTYFWGWMLLPIRSSYGSTWEQYLQEEPDSIDVLYFGSSLVYSDVIPAIIWEETGLTSYVMAGCEQTIPISYYYLREACKTQTPQAVVVELTGMGFHEFQNYTEVNIGYMPWSLNRIAATLYAAEPEARLGLLFPLYNYHERIYSVTQGELRRHLNPQPDPMAGYTVLTGASAQTRITTRNFATDTDTYRNNLKYLGKISDFCAAHEIQLVFYVAPAYRRIPEETLETLKRDIAPLTYEAFWDCNDGTWQAADPQRDWFDLLHYNLRGAIPFSRQLGQRLAGLGLTPTRENSALWHERVDAIYKIQSALPDAA